MNHSQLTCDPQRIEMFLQQQLSDDEQALLESHLDDCRHCRERLEMAAAGEDVWSGVRASLNSEPLPPDWLTSSDDSVVAKEAEDSMTHATIAGRLAPTNDDRMIGRLGTYEVVGIIGTGGMGVVLKAFDAALNRYVAIKVLAPHLANSGAARKRFSREAQAAAAVVHENLMEIHGVSDADGLPYLVMPYVRGPSLQRRLDDEGPLALVEILRIARQAASGLAAAHAQGMVHRDVKPANILLADGIERVKLTDFGLARTADDASLTRTGTIAGTPQYMSPEQARGEPVDPRSDLFSLGSVLYTMCTGRPPFRAETSYGVLRRITDERPRPIREINPEIPQWLCRIIARLMAKQPGERFESAAEVARLLEDCLAHVQQPDAVPLPESCALADDDQPKRASVRFIRKPWASARRLILLAFTAVLLLAGVVVTLERNKGTLTIESEADDVSVRITQGDTLVDQLTVTQAGAKARVAAGTYLVEIDGEADGIVLENGTVTLKRGGTEIVRLVQRSAADGEELHPDFRDILGHWEVVSVEGTGGRFMSLTDQNEPGDRLVIPHAKAWNSPRRTWLSEEHRRNWSRNDSLHLHPETDPPRLTYKPRDGQSGHFEDPSNPPDYGIYRLEGDELTILAGDPNDITVKEGTDITSAERADEDGETSPGGRATWRWKFTIPNYASKFALQEGGRQILVKLRRLNE